MNRTFDATLAANGVSYRQGTSEGLRGLIRLLTRVPFTDSTCDVAFSFTL